MEYTNNIDPLEFTMSCIVLIGYISGKVWMYYRIEDKPKGIQRIKSGRKSKSKNRGIGNGSA